MNIPHIEAKHVAGGLGVAFSIALAGIIILDYLSAMSGNDPKLWLLLENGTVIATEMAKGAIAFVLALLCASIAVLKFFPPDGLGFHPE